MSLFMAFNFFLNNDGKRLKIDRKKISIATIIEGDFSEYISVDGQILPVKSVRLDAIEGGVDSKKHLDGGVLVSKGDTILELTNTDMLQSFMREETQAYMLLNNLENTKFQLGRNLLDQKRTLIDLSYQLDAAKAVYERNTSLNNKKVIAEVEFLDTQREYNRLKDIYALQVESNKFDSLNSALQITQTNEALKRTAKNLEMIKLNLNNLYIKATMDGRLSTVNVEVGESITSGQNIGQIDDLNGFKVRVLIDQFYISRIYAGQTGTFSFAEDNFDLLITKVYPEVNNGFFQIDLAFRDSIPKGISRGQTPRISLQLSDNIQAIQIPRSNFYQVTGGQWVFVLNSDETMAERREIKLGRQNPLNYEVIDGLTPGEKVIVSSYDGFEDMDILVIR